MMPNVIDLILDIVKKKKKEQKTNDPVSSWETKRKIKTSRSGEIEQRRRRSDLIFIKISFFFLVKLS